MYLVFHKTKNNSFKVYDGVKIETLTAKPTDKSTFEMLNKKYKATDDGLIKYHADILVASNELKKSNELKHFDYIMPFKMDDGKLFYKNHYVNIMMIFKKFAPKNWNNHQKINQIEGSWFERCNNGGLQYCKVGEHQSFGYDFNNFYARLLGDDRFSELQIPTKQGTESIILELPERFSFGMYHVKVVCDDDDIKKLFSFSSHHIYTHYSLNFIYDLLKKTNLNINLELIQDGKPNAYIYQDEDIVKTSSIFDNWFKNIIALKKKYPNNILIKMLSSSLWGHLSERNSIFCKVSQVDEDTDFKIIDIVTRGDGNEYYELLDAETPYKYNLRLKPFLTAFGRNKTARVALRMIYNVIRIHTDGICFNTEYKTKTENLSPEAKTTGRINFITGNDYHFVL